MFNSLFKPQKENSFGINIPVNNKSLSAEINEVGEKFIKTNKSYREEIEKYKKIAAFNKTLSKSYITNITAMIDVSKLLNEYSLFFDILKNEINETNNSLGSIDKNDIEYLKNLTKDRLDQLINVFKLQTNKVKGLYEKFGQVNELDNIKAAQILMDGVSNSANVTYSSINGGSVLRRNKKN